ncbi:MAG: DegV family protein [Clostridiales bacterium]|nr:DegV family protein [Clostridiales bacterium]
MIKIFVDSGSSIRQDETHIYNVEILPLKILIKDVEYSDGINLTMDTFYKALIEDHQFPKTSLPSLEDTETRVLKAVEDGFDVIIITISSKISGTNNAFNMLFKDNPHVRVIDSRSAVGGMKILVREAQKYLDKPLDFICDKLNALAPRITALAVPETLEYLHRGGRLSMAGYAIGTILKIKPVLMLKNSVSVAGKVIGLKSAMRFLSSALDNCDTDYPIIPSYTYDTANLKELISRTPSEYVKIMTEFDNIDPAVACHWGPNAFGYVFVEKESEQ